MLDDALEPQGGVAKNQPRETVIPNSEYRHLPHM